MEYNRNISKRYGVVAMKLLRSRLGRMFTFRWRDLAVTLGIFALASVLCTLLRFASDSDFHVPLIFVLAVLVVSLTTEGYLWGMLGTVAAVLGVNYAFTYPYFQLDFSLTGYPLTFICMFAVSFITCTLTSRVREGEKARIEGEREKMRANLLRAISHDFRTPLTGIIGSINAVQENGGSLAEAERRQLLSDARSEAEWLINMVENLLSITRIGGDGSAALHKEPQVVEEVVWEAVTRFRKQYPDFSVEIKIPEELLLVDMDAVLIEQVILNLLINAAVHGETSDAAVVSVACRHGMAQFSVQDNGVGIRQEELAHLFDGYGLKKGDGTARTAGIGLSVCDTIIRAHGGSMAAENVSGGARISFTLPLSGEKGDGNGDQAADSDR